MSNPVISHCSFCLAHVPDLVRHGSKPRREIAKDPSVLERINASLRSFDDALAYAPNQTYIGNMTPHDLAGIQQPWHGALQPNSKPVGSFGEIINQDQFYALLSQADVLTPPLVNVVPASAATLNSALVGHRVLAQFAERKAVNAGRTVSRKPNDLDLELSTAGALRALVSGDEREEGREDENLQAHHLLEALCTKASAALALESLIVRSGIDRTSIDYIISCGEEAVGDRYQRGGGGMAKAIGEMCGLACASGMDVKNFCAAPASALTTAGALVSCGLYDRVVVVAGGSLAKLGMKFQALLREGLPLLGDCLGCMAILVSRDDGTSPILRLERGTVGVARIGASTSDEAIYRELIQKPLLALGLKMTDIDAYAPELHNAELMQHSGSGDVAHKNYRMIAAMAVLTGAIERSQMTQFVTQIGMPGFAPPQGHIPSGVPYLGHALRAMTQGKMKRAMFICKASLFLNRLTTLYDGVSFVVEARTPTP